MNKLIGIKPFLYSILQKNYGDIKRDFLFFDQLHLIGCKEWLERDIKNLELKGKGFLLENHLEWFHKGYAKFVHSENTKLDEEEKSTLIQHRKTYEFLLKNEKLIYDAKSLLTLPEVNNSAEATLIKTLEIENYFHKLRNEDIKKKEWKDYNKFYHIASNLASRQLSIIANTREGIEASPIVPSLILPDQNKKTEVINIILKNFPVPDENIPWEQIFEFRSDPDIKGKTLGLKVWLNDIIKTDQTPSEISDKLEYTLYNYQKKLDLHKIKTNKSTWEIIAVTSLEVIENAMKLKLSKTVETIFKLKKEKINLFEAELNTEGSQLSLFYAANQRFK